MGTTTSYNAPTSPQWGNIKRKITRLASRDNLSPDDAKDILGSYIAASGGAEGIVGGRGSISGGGRAVQSTARRIGGFFSAVSQVGLAQTLIQYGLGSLAGKSVADVIFMLLDALGGPSSTIDDVDARNAASDLFRELFEEAQNEADVKRILEQNSQGNLFADLLFRFFGYYLYEQFCRVFYDRLITRLDANRCQAFLDRIRDYILSALRLEVWNRDIAAIRWSGEDGKALADQILQGTFAVFGGQQ